MTWLQRQGWELPLSHTASRFHTGDIVCWQIKDVKHIGIVSNGRDPQETPLVIHNFNAGTIESDMLFKFPLIAHYRPVVHASIASMHEADSTIIKRSHPFVNLAIEGGGVLGVAYVPILEYMEENGVLDGIERVAGTSSGSIVATLVALRYTPAEIRGNMRDIDFEKFEDEGHVLDVASHYGYFRGDYAMELFKGYVKNKLGSPDATFADLHNHGGRDLMVFATNLSRKRVQEFSFNKSPDFKIAHALRASMSIPLFFDAVNLDGEILVDGSVVLNYPIMVFGIDELPRTIGMAFEHAHPVLSAGAADDKFGYGHPVQYVRNLFDVLIGAQATIWIRDPEIRRQSILINTGEISNTEFSLTDGDKDFLLDQGRIAAEQFFEAYNLEHFGH